ncbi:MAG: efflux RND transporter periplasmic adaptor subunit [Clostridia bacterium]|nr:efflux RND transporter periplasmic adaptor subunit [Clostridia bacterium]
MKRIACLFPLLLLFPVLALAATADAIVIAPHTVKLTAPFSGTLLPFDVQEGDVVTAGQALFKMDTLPVYATQSGIVSDVFAAVGDDAAGVAERYGGLAALEPTNAMYIDDSNKEAHDDAQSKWLHAGETLYLKRNNDRGTGRVTMVNGDDYIVEILSGPFKAGDTVRCYRESSYSTDSETGRGKVRRYPDIRVNGRGRVAAVHIAAGDRVEAGDLLFEMVSSDSAKDFSAEISAPVGGAVSTLAVRSGAQVLRGQLLAEVADLSRLELSCDLDEIDYASVHVGDSLSFTLDAYPGRTFSGTVTLLRPIGEKRTNATYFDLRLTLPTDVPLSPGMNGTVTLNP